jgi:hypothetical protein
MTKEKEPMIINTKATTRFLKAIIKHEPLTISGADIIDYLGLTSRQGFISLSKRLEGVGLVSIVRNKPLPNTYTVTKDREILKKYAYLLKNKVKLSLVD